MVSKRLFSFRRRLFVPMVAMMWLIIGVMMLYQYSREIDYRREDLQRQLHIITTRIFWAYENDLDMRPFIRFIDLYFDETIFDDLHVSVYDKDADLIYSIDKPLLADPTPDDLERMVNDFEDGVHPQMDGIEMNERLFFFLAEKSSDGKIYAFTAMPYTISISDALGPGIWFWILLLALAIGVTVFTYYYIGYLTRGVSILYDFATRAAKGAINLSGDPDASPSGGEGGAPKLDVSNIKFPKNDLGEITRKILDLYIEKDRALQRIEKEHNIALHALEEKADIKRRLTNNINHELKTPVGIVSGYLETILSNPDMDEAMRTRFLQKAQSKVNELCGLLRDVNTMSRLEDGSGKIPTTDVNFHDLIFTIDDELAQSGVLETMKFVYDIPMDCVVRGNQTLLNSAVTNLIKNAAIHSHGTTCGIKLLTASERFYSFAFWDDGVGVPEEHMPHLFERFYRVEAGRMRNRVGGGTGLGLPIVKSTIEALGGTISIHNRTTSGLQIIFTLEKWTENKKNH